MSKILHIEASPSKERSHTRAVASAFLAAYERAHPDDVIETLDVWSIELPPFDAAALEAKFAVLRRNVFTPEQLARWEALRAISRHFNSANKYVFSVPMWNFGIPYPLKHYIDVVTLPSENWTWSREKGYGTILTGKKALLVHASANVHEESGEYADDFQKPYMRRWLRFLGIDDVQEITISPTLASPEEVAARRTSAMAAAEQLAAVF